VERRAFERALRSPVSRAQVEELRITLHEGPVGQPVVGSEGSVL
jgi:C4-type Zn-finger protein